MSYKDPVARREYSKLWMRKRRKNIDLTKVEKEKVADDLLGNACFFCGRTKGERKLVRHKRDGQPHQRNSVAGLVIKNPDDWALLCSFPCHIGVHWCMEVWRLSWDEIVKVFKVNSKERNSSRMMFLMAEAGLDDEPSNPSVAEKKKPLVKGSRLVTVSF